MFDNIKSELKNLLSLTNGKGLKLSVLFVRTELYSAENCF